MTRNRSSRNNRRSGSGSNRRNVLLLVAVATVVLLGVCSASLGGGWWLITSVTGGRSSATTDIRPSWSAESAELTIAVSPVMAPVLNELAARFNSLDLRTPDMQRKMRTRTRLVAALRRYLDERGFQDIETPILTKATPEGARDFLVPARMHPGEFYALPQSPQLFKQILMMAGFDRYYQIARCFRDEALRADRQLEFTQLDMEFAWVSERDVQDTVEEHQPERRRRQGGIQEASDRRGVSGRRLEPRSHAGDMVGAGPEGDEAREQIGDQEAEVITVHFPHGPGIYTGNPARAKDAPARGPGQPRAAASRLSRFGSG